MKLPLFFQRRFWPMWTALSLGAFADNMLRQALIIGIAFGAIKAGGFSDADGAIPIVGSLFAVSMLVFSTISGQLAEKYETAMLFRRIKFAEVILMAVAAVGFFTNSGWLLIATLFAMGAQSAFFSPVRLAAMPKYLKPDELVRGNGLCNAGLYVSILIGLFLGGLLIARPDGAKLVAGGLVAAAFFGWLAVLRAPHAAPGAPDLRLDWNPIAQSIRIFGFVLRAPGVVRPLLGPAFFFYTSTLVTVLVPIYVKTSLHADEAVATTIMGIFAIGAGLGAMMAAALSKGRSGLGFSGLGVAGAGLMGALIFLLTDAVAPQAGPGSLGVLTGSAGGLALVAAFCLSAALMGLFIAPLQAAAQRRAPPAERARILAAGNMLNAAAAILGSLSVLAVTETDIDPKAAFLIVAGLQGAVALYMLIRRRRAPAGLFDAGHFRSHPVENPPSPFLSPPSAG
jgi:MFS family permease